MLAGFMYIRKIDQGEHEGKEGGEGGEERKGRQEGRTCQQQFRGAEDLGGSLALEQRSRRW